MPTSSPASDVLNRLQPALQDRYVLEREVGSGGMAVVYLAHDLRHDRAVAIKVLRPEFAAAIGAERFLNEIKLVARLAHPHILPLHDSGEAGGLLYFVMPYVAGESLRHRLARDGTLPVAEAIQIAREVADALSDAHAHEIVHRDIKPENILLEAGHAVVTDFGIARVITAATELRVTSEGVALGTQRYMSPEQADGSNALDGRCDIYSLGCVLYEMLVGRPPEYGLANETGASARTTRHPLPVLMRQRPDVPRATAAAVKRALSVDPSARFASAMEFSNALAPTPTLAAVLRRLLTRRTAVRVGAGAVLTATAIVAWLALRLGPILDPRRVVIYPLVVSGPDSSLAESMTDALLAAFNSTVYLKPLDGWRFVNESERRPARRPPPEASRSLAEHLGAGFLVEGQLVVGDSVRLLLFVNDLAADSIVSRPLAFTKGTDPWEMGIKAATELLPLLIPSGSRGDLHYLENRPLAAASSFLQGERAYRHARFSEALEHYRNAVRIDSGFAQAALKGAQLASWNLKTDVASQLVRVALAHDSVLTPRDRQLALGFEAYLTSRADSAVRHFRAALVMDPESAEAWMGLGEVYTHLLPSESPLDSLAEAAFAEVRDHDPEFVPVLYHLIEIALRRGDTARADTLLRQFSAAGPDSLELVPSQMMLECVSKSPSEVDWRAYMRRKADYVREAGRSLMVGGLHQAACAEAAWRAILAHDTTTVELWGALQGLQSILIAQGKYRDVEALLDANTLVYPWAHGALYMLYAAAGAGAPIDGRAAAAADSLSGLFESDPLRRSSTSLWHLAIWDIRVGRLDQARVIRDSLGARAAARGGSRVDRLLAKSVAARVALAGKDTTTAMALLAELVPAADRPALTWNASESLGGERLLLAELELARGRYSAASSIASNFDAPAPVPYVMYLPRALAIRLSAAEHAGDRRQAAQIQSRIDGLSNARLIRRRP